MRLSLFRLVGLDRLERRLDYSIHLLQSLHRKENALMSLGQDFLDAIATLTASVAALRTDVDTIIANVETLITSGTITAEQGQAILGGIVTNTGAVDAAKAALDAELAKLNPPPPPTPLS